MFLHRSQVSRLSKKDLVRGFESGGNRSRKRKSEGKEEDVGNALFCVSNTNCRPRCASFPAALEAKSLRPSHTQGTDYTPVYLTRAAEI